MSGQASVAGQAVTPEGVVRVAAEWAGVVARRLDRPPLTGPISLKIHDRPGVAHVRGNAIHLFQGLQGGPDLSQLPHELVHLVAGPSPSRFLGEGLAVHVAACADLAEPCWPSYGAHPDAWVMELAGRRRPEPLSTVVAGAETVRLGKPNLTRAEFLGGWRLYLVAGSFTGFLFETLERERFWEGFQKGACWRDDTELEERAREWQAWLPESPRGPGGAVLVGALRYAARQMDLAPWDPDVPPDSKGGTAGGPRR